MKKILFLISILVIVQKLTAQQNYCDFEGKKVLSFGARNGILDSLIENPNPNSINNSAHCAKYIRDTALYDNIKFFPYTKLGGGEVPIQKTASLILK